MKYAITLASALISSVLALGADELMGQNGIPEFTKKDVSSLGLDVVEQYTGYASVKGGKNSLFYWFFASRNDPANDPVMLWLNGGPGCSSLKGTLWVNGPSNIQPDLSMQYNPYSWNNNASIIYLDEPAGTGLSPVSEDVNYSWEAAEQVYEFLDLFFKNFPQYQKNAFHLSGQSDAGHYIAATGAEILQHPDRKFNFSSVSIGNGLIDTAVQYGAMEPFFCGKTDDPALLNQTACAAMATEVPNCVKQINDYNSGKLTNGSSIMKYCNDVTLRKFDGNLFDVDHACSNTSYECYPPDAYYSRYMNQPHVLEAVGSRKSSFVACNMTIVSNWGNSGARLGSNTGNLSTVLQNDIPVLLFAGDDDATYGWFGNSLVAKNIEWSGQERYQKSSPVTWKINGNDAGDITNFDKLTFIRYYNASHLISVSNPPAGTEMLNQWFAGNYQVYTNATAVHNQA